MIGVMLIFVGCTKKDAPSATMRVTFVGDTGLGDQAVEFVKQYGLAKSFEKIRASLGDTDFLIGNAETPIADADLSQRHPKPWHPKQVPEAAMVYANEGFSAFSLANNHALDFDLIGMHQTRESLKKVGIRTFGAGDNEREARKPLILNNDGLQLAILGYFEQQKKYVRMGDWFAAGDQPGVARLSKKNLREDIAALKKQGYLVVVFPHWGINYRKATKQQQRMARVAVKAGADLVVGHGAHMVQDVELIDGVPVLYSIGNFIWHSKGKYHNKGVKDYAYTLVTQVAFDKNGVTSIRLTPYHSNNRVVNFIPQPARKRRAKKLFDDILKPIGKRWRMVDGAALIELR